MNQPIFLLFILFLTGLHNKYYSHNSHGIFHNVRLPQPFTKLVFTEHSPPFPSQNFWQTFQSSFLDRFSNHPLPLWFHTAIIISLTYTRFLTALSPIFNTVFDGISSTLLSQDSWQSSSCRILFISPNHSPQIYYLSFIYKALDILKTLSPITS